MDSGETNQNNQAPATPAQSQPSSNTSTVDNATLMGIFSYLGPLVLVPLLTTKDNTFVRFHTRQGLVLFVAEIALWMITMMLPMLAFLFMFVNLGLIILSILGIVNVINKKQEELPIVGQFSKYFNNI